MDGYLILLKLANSVVEGIVSTNFNFEADEVNLTGKGSGRDSEYSVGDHRGDFNVEGRFDKTHTYGFKELFDAKQAGAAIAFAAGECNADKTDFSTADYAEQIQGNCIILGLTWGGSRNAPTTFTARCRITGTPIMATIASA